jgi:dTDP-4-amino-4,6-dideoxygalactose transaminase
MRSLLPAGGGQFPQAEELAARSLSLPMYPELPLEHLERVANAIRRHYQA